MAAGVESLMDGDAARDSVNAEMNFSVMERGDRGGLGGIPEQIILAFSSRFGIR